MPSYAKRKADYVDAIVDAMKKQPRVLVAMPLLLLLPKPLLPILCRAAPQVVLHAAALPATTALINPAPTVMSMVNAPVSPDATTGNV